MVSLWTRLCVSCFLARHMYCYFSLHEVYLILDSGSSFPEIDGDGVCVCVGGVCVCVGGVHVCLSVFLSVCLSLCIYM